MRTLTVSLVMLFLAAGCSRFENTVVVTNESDSAINGVTVSVCESTWTIEILNPGESKTFKATYNSDDHFRVSSPALNGDFGYVTSGLTGDRVVIVFREDRIDFTQSTAGY